MIELPLIFVAGFMGSAHCVGMCGPFAMMLGSNSQQTWLTCVGRQVVYSIGRVFTYSVLGALSGFCGLRLAEASSFLVNVPATISIVAGSFLVFYGLQTAGFIRKIRSKKTSTSKHPCLSGGILSHFLRSTNRFDVFLAGVLTGFLPCGLVYGFLGMAATTHDIAMGSLTMAVFGMGTVPIMIATGFGGRLLSVAFRSRLLVAASWCIVLVGVATIFRGTSFVQSGDQPVVESCPFCNE